MRELSLMKSVKALFLSSALVLAGCGEELQINDDAQEAAINNGTPFAFVARDLTSEQETLALREQRKDHAAYLPGSRLVVRSAISSDASDTEILSSVFSGPYDVKDLSVSSDGRYLLFAAHGGTQAHTWNLYEYDFEEKTVKRIFEEDDVANTGHDVSPTYTNDDKIVFSSNRGTGSEFVLYTVSRDGDDLKALLETDTARALSLGDQVEARNLKDGTLIFKGQSATQQNVHSIQPNGEQLKSLYQDVNNLTDTDLQKVEITHLMQGNDGRLMAILKNKENPLLGGTLVQLLGTKVEDSSLPTGRNVSNAVYDKVHFTPLGDNNKLFTDNVTAKQGYVSAFWPYRDGTNRALVSWSSCMQQDSGRYVPCTDGNKPEGVDPRYGIWVLDANNNTRMPVLQGKANRIYTEIALAYPNMGENLKFDEELPDVPDTTDPDTTDPDTTDPDTTDPDTTDPDTTDPDTTDPDTTDPDTTDPDTTDPDTTDPDTTDPDTTDPDTTDPDTTDPDTTDPDTTDPDTTDPDTTDPDTTDPDTTDPDTTDPDTTDPDTTDPDTTDPDTTDPDTTDPDTTDPDTTDPDTTDPDTTDPDTTDPDTTDPDTTDPDTTDPDTTDPENNAPVANAGEDVLNQSVGTTVMLDGSASSDADGDALSYNWRVISSPVEGADNLLTDADSVQPTLTLLERGVYVIELVVNDGTVNSAADTVMVEATVDDQVCVPGKQLSIWSAVASQANPNQLVKDAFLGNITSFQGAKTPDASYDYYSYSAHPTFVADEFNDTLPQPKDSSAHIFFYESKVDHPQLSYSNTDAVKPRGEINEGDLFLYFFFNKDASGQSNNKVFFEVLTQGNESADGISQDQVILSDDGHELISFSTTVGKQYQGDFQYWHNTDGGVIGPFRGEEFTVAVRATSNSPVGENLTGASFFSREGTEYNFFKDPNITSFIVTYKEEQFCDDEPVDTTDPDTTDPDTTDPDTTDPDTTDPDTTDPDTTDPDTTDPDTTDPDTTDPDTTDPVGQPDGQCYGKGYWKNHNRYAAQEHKQTPWPVHEDTQICSTSWYQMVNQPAHGDAWNILGSHYVTARLNEANIGSVPQDIADALNQAQTLMAQCSVSEADRSFALSLKDQLEQFTEEDNCGVSTDPVEPEQPTASVVHIRSVYDDQGTDVSKHGINDMADPTAFAMHDRQERFVRVWVHPDFEAKALKGYAPIQPDGSVVFELPAFTRFSYEVTNQYGKALDSAVMLGANDAYTHFNESEVITSGDVATVTCVDCDSNVNIGALDDNYVWPNTRAEITASDVGDTMALALYKAQPEQAALNTRIQYQDWWTPLALEGSPAVDLGYDGISTEKPVSIACEQELDATCVAKANYETHIKPLWNKSGRDEAGNACADCHDNRGFTKLDLSDFSASSQDALFGKQATYMYLANRFSEVSDQHCRRVVQPPFTIQPENDCFSCYEQSYMSELGAIASANFFDLFDEDSSDDHWVFKPLTLDSDAEQRQQEVKDLHQGMLTASEMKMIAEWLDRGAQ